MLSGKDIAAGVLAAFMMLSPLAAAAWGALHAPPQTVQKSGAMPPGDNRPPAQADPTMQTPAAPAPK